jgi:hypothetical protein
MSDDNTQDGAEPSPASAGSQNTHMATARLAAANTWLQEEIKRLRLTNAEREAIGIAISLMAGTVAPQVIGTLRGALERLG